MAVLKRALHLKKTLGVRCAAGFLRNRGTSFEAALFLLVRAEPRD